jgi:hypothetical protein
MSPPYGKCRDREQMRGGTAAMRGRLPSNAFWELAPEDIL